MSQNGRALSQLRAEGVQTYAFPDDVWEAFGRAADEVNQENMGDDLYKRIHDSAMSSMLESSAWIQESETTYRAQRDRILG